MYSTILTADTAAVRFRTQLIDAARMRTRVSSGSSGSASIVDSRNCDVGVWHFVTLLARRRARRRIQRSLCHDRRGHVTAVMAGIHARLNSWWLDRTHRTRLSVIFQEHTDLSRSWKNASSCKCQRSRRSCADSHVVISGRRFAGRRSSRCTRRRNVVKRFVVAVVVAGMGAGFAPALVLAGAQTAPREGTARGAGAAGFQVEEATIGDLHRAIQDGRTTCAAVVRAYVERARAYNGSCTRQVTSHGAPVTPRPGTVRAGVPLSFPAETLAIADILPALNQYSGLPIEYGRLEPTKSDPDVHQQYGMVVGIPNAGQINALNTLNLRGERSVTCKGAFDAHPSTGPLPAGAPPACEAFRQQPDALERAAELDAQYGQQPDLQKMPMYCVAFSFKDVYRHEGHAFDRRRRRRLCDRRRPRRRHHRRPAAREGRDRLRQGQPIRIQRRQRQSRAGRQGRRRATSAPEPAARGVAPAAILTTRRARRAARARGRRPRSAPTWCSARSARKQAARAASPPGATASSSLVTTKGLIPYGGAIGADPYLDRAGITAARCRTRRSCSTR